MTQGYSRILTAARAVNSVMQPRIEAYLQASLLERVWPGSDLSKLPGVGAEFIQRSLCESFPELAGSLNLGNSAASLHWLNTRNVTAGFFHRPISIQVNQLDGAYYHK